AAGDSIDVSTFRAIPIEGLDRQVETTLLNQIGEPERRRALEVLNYLQVQKWPVALSERLSYLATIAGQSGEVRVAVGGALYQLGLIPDFDLLIRPEELPYRIGQRNLPAVRQLREQSMTPLARVLRLPLADETFRDRLLSLFQLYRPDEVRQWGETVAIDPIWRDLAMERWPLGGDRPPPGVIRIDIDPLAIAKRREDGVKLLKASERIAVKWQTIPRPSDVPGLAYFRVEVLDADRNVVWESPLIKSGGGTSPRRSRTIAGLTGLDSGVYFFRLAALNDAGDPFPEQERRNPEAGEWGKRTNESEDFLLLADVDGDEETLTDIDVPAKTDSRSYAEAELLSGWSALLAGKDLGTARSATREWSTPLEARAEVAIATIRFDLQRQYSVGLSQRLRLLEMAVLASPDDGGHYRWSLDSPADDAQVLRLKLPDELAEARRELFVGIVQQGAAEGGAAIALTDLCTIARQIEQYARAYEAWLATGDPAALCLDVVLCRIPEEQLTVGLVAPTHPLRLLWAVQAQELAREWLRRAREETAVKKAVSRLPVDQWRSTLLPQGIPPMLVLDAEHGYLEAGPLPGGWEVYLPPRLPDSRAILALIRKRLGAGSDYKAGADASPTVLADKLEHFLRQHPYTPALILNVVNPGNAALVVDALVDLENRRASEMPELRYQVRLFAEQPQREGLGEAFADLMDPERQISEAAERLRARGRSFLFPKLSWSRNPLNTFVEAPERFPAHLTLLLDSFPVVLRVARTDEKDRTSFVHGLIQEAPRRSVGRGRAHSWIRLPSPAACAELPAAPHRSALIAGMLESVGWLQARILAPNTDTEGFTAVSALDLSSSGQSLLYSAHAVSTWVLTLDSNLGLDYFDTARSRDQAGYLLDFTPEFVAAGARQLLLTTRIDEEVLRLVEPATTQLGFDADSGGDKLVLEAMRSLSGRLALRLLSAPSQIQGALGMALSRLFLEAYGLLNDAVVIPLDAHPELAEHEGDPLAPSLRGDLLLARAAPSQRQIDLLLVEAKCHAGTGLSADLRSSIAAQLQSSENGLRERFDPSWREPDRIDRAVQNWRLASVLTFYLERACRYGLVSQDTEMRLRAFFTDLDGGYSVAIRKLGLVFRPETPGTTVDHLDPELPICVIGREEVRKIANEALRRFNGAAPDETEAGDHKKSPTPGASMAGHSTWNEVCKTFGKLAVIKSLGAAPLSAGIPNQSEAKGTPEPAGEAPPEPSPAPQSREEHGSIPPTSALALTGSPTPVAPSPPEGPEFSVLLGDTRPTPQFGLLGAMSTEPWRRVALDVNGCNTISVFGVQGSGKSYTVGAIIEIATRALPGLNRLPRPLGSVVFHYHQTQDYPPEFVSMSEPNDDLSQVEALKDWGAVPTGVQDLLVLTTADLLEERRQEFSGVRIEPISFSSSELTVADWRFLMGATGSDALYLKLINEIMRKARADLTLAAIQAGIASAPLSDAQRTLAETRLEFAARFIDDSRSLRSLLRPGRLIIVDLRDEFVEKEQALGLFVTMLNVFSGAGLGGEPFNKLIVFDEAHKYMGGPLIGHVVEVIREMRHKGVTAIIASQDPVNVPPAIIELSSVVAVHRFNSPNWLRHIQKSLAALGDLTPAMLASLAPGEAFVWANRATDPIFMRRAIKVKIRPRVTKHGGSTRTAISD
ncbi:MAG: hypothetical protein ACR2PL_14845, partial [Dehalococcoidia bacterium]